MRSDADGHGGEGSRPTVTLHYAQTLDGRIATRAGHSRWISCASSLQLAHRLRAEHRAVMVGVGTVFADNPRLTVRLVPGESPLRVIVDSTLRLPLDAHVLADGAAPTLVATTRRAPEDRLRDVASRGADVLVVGQEPSGRVDLRDLLRQLGRMEISSLLIEGGAGIITSALHDCLVERIVVCIAPKVIGSGIEAIGNLDILRMEDALRFTETRFSALGGDVIFDGQLATRCLSGDARSGTDRVSGR